MAVTEKYTAVTSRGNVLTTDLNALGTGSYSAAGPLYDNSGNQDQFGYAFLTCTWGTNPTANKTVDLFYVASLDAGVTYEDGGGSVRPNPMNHLGSFIVQAVTTIQKIRTARFQLPSLPLKFVAYNGSGFALPASGTTIALYTFNRQVG